MPLQYQAMSHKFISNPWTSIPHGHARTELNLLKILIKQNTPKCSIISESKDFGDIIVTRSSHTLGSKIFQRNPFYTLLRYWKIYCYFRETFVEFRRIAVPGDDLIFSSVNFEQFVIAAIFFPKEKFSLRIFNCPTNNLTKKYKYFTYLIQKRSLIKIGAETKEIANWLRINLNIDALIVPPLTLLRNQIKPIRKTNNDSKDLNVGILYPVTSNFDHDEFQSALNSLEGRNIKVKLPLIAFSKNDPIRFELIPNGLSDDALNEIIYNLDGVILMNHNYINRGSGLLTLCMSLGCQIFVFSDNSYLAEYLGHYPLIQIDDVMQLRGNKNLEWRAETEAESWMKFSHEFVNYVNSKWEEFIYVS
jgi:hypothetical protein